jgi:hypothetical protein
MKLEIQQIKDRGKMDERIVFIANEDCDIGRYFVFTTKKKNEKVVFTHLTEPYWFPDKLVKKGDLVVLYTKVGNSSFKVYEDQTTSHFYYRKIATPILNDKNAVLLVEATTWKTEKSTTSE